MNCLMTAWHDNESELRSWLRHRLGNPVDADDVLQDLFIKAMRQGEHFCEIGNARAWLFEVARNALADRLRLKREMVELPTDLADETEEVATVDSLVVCLPRVLSELSPEDREAITLCDLQGVPQDEYARRKGLSLPGVRMNRTLGHRADGQCQLQQTTGACRNSSPSLHLFSDWFVFSVWGAICTPCFDEGVAAWMPYWPH